MMAGNRQRPHRTRRRTPSLTVTRSRAAIGLLCLMLASSLPVVAQDQGPAADFTWSPESPAAGTPVSFQDLSTSSQGQITSWFWEFGDGTTSDLQHPEKTYTSAGAYTVQLTVTDSYQEQDSTTQTIQVVPPNEAPVADFTHDPQEPTELDNVTLTSTAFDPDGAIDTWEWDLGPAGKKTGPVVEARFPPGEQTIVHTVTDGDGEQATHTRVITVTAAPGALGGSLPPGPLQQLIDGAEPGERVEIPPGEHDEPLVITKPLTLTGAPDTVIDGGDFPALTIHGNLGFGDGEPGRHPQAVVVKNLTFRSGAGTQGNVAVQNQPSVELWNTTLENGPLWAENTPNIRIITPQDEDPPELELTNATAHHLRLVRLRVLYADNTAWPGAPVNVQDEDRTIYTGTSDEDGLLPWLAVPRSHMTPTGTTQAQARAVVDDDEVFGLEQGSRTIDLLTSRQAPGPATIHPAVFAALFVITLSAGAMALVRFHPPFRWRWLLIFTPLFSRLHRSKLLDQENRNAIYEQIEANPGIHFRELKRAVDLRHGTLLHHLQMLETHGLVHTVRDGMYRRYRTSGTKLPGEPEPPLGQAVVQRIRTAPGITNRELAEALGKKPGHVHYHVERLTKAGTVQKEREGREVRLYPARWREHSGEALTVAPSAAGG